MFYRWVPHLQTMARDDFLSCQDVIKRRGAGNKTPVSQAQTNTRSHTMPQLEEWKQLNATMTLLTELLSEVLEDLGMDSLLTQLKHLREQVEMENPQQDSALREMIVGLTEEESFHVALATTVWLDLYNLTEDEFRRRILMQREQEQHPSPIEESIAHTLSQLKEQGVSSKHIQALLDQLDIELVFTAHPTEIKRRTVLSKFQRMAEQLPTLSGPYSRPRAKQRARKIILEELTSLWLTRRSRTIQPSVTDEVRTGLYFLEHTLWEAIPELYTTLQEALETSYPDVTAKRGWLRVASWIGGDRDGNPNVTAKITAETLRLHRGLAVERHRKAINQLSRHLSIQSDRLSAKESLEQWFQSRHPLPKHVTYLQERYPDELYRLSLGLIAYDLEQASREPMVANLLSDTEQKARIQPHQVDQILGWIEETMPPSLRAGRLQELRQQLAAFGMHAAKLDIREDSQRINQSLGEALRALNISPNFDQLDDEARTACLLEQLQAPIPALPLTPGFRIETAQTWALFRLLDKTRKVFGASSLGPFIISMTQGPADILAVLLMARWCGNADGQRIVPLFETVDDLNAAPAILKRLFSVPAYREHLASCGDHQMIMVGYSDSNKDGGFLASRWSLHQAQAAMVKACQESNIQYSFFHGSGGTVARGGGPTNRSIQALPSGALNGHFRVTEQGEVISARYTSKSLARRHLEQITSAVLLTSHKEQVDDSIPTEWHDVMDVLTEHSLRAYRELVFSNPSFLRFWQWVTPIDEINKLRIGSRPATRRGGALEPGHIRAIPWVFSWMQSRFNLPGWFGLGRAFSAGDFEHKQLQEMYQQWPFFQVLVDSAEMSLIKAHMPTASLYVSLAEDKALADDLFEHIQDAYQQTQEAVLSVTQRPSLLAHRSTFQLQIEARNRWLRPIHHLQVETLRRLRSCPQDNTHTTEELRRVMLQTFNGIASGLRSTG
ncbi:MAG: hypothetical protein CL920_24605 [Deltaproteobacteria bacterium]|nr:hypothetical protein [Deltaproteobacteria bacterium]